MRQKYNFCCVWSRTDWESIATPSSFFICLNNMAVKLSFDECKWLLKSYWKVENVVEVQWRWRVEFGTPQPTRVTITTIRDMFEVDGTVPDVLKGRWGRKTSSTDNESADAVVQVFSRSPRKSWGNVLRECHKIKTLDELRDQIEHAVNGIPLSTIQTVCRSVVRLFGSVLWQKVDILNMYGLKKV